MWLLSLPGSGPPFIASDQAAQETEALKAASSSSAAMPFLMAS